MMRDFLITHPYLVANIPTLIVIVLLGRRYRTSDIGRLVIPAGLLCLPSSLIAFTFEGDYWSPARLGGLQIGLEDLVFCFDAGALAWFAAAWPFRRRLLTGVDWRATWMRYLLIGLLSGGTIIGCQVLGCHSMVGFTLASLSALAVVLALRVDLWVLAASGAVLYTAIHVVSVKVQFAIWPGYSSLWNPHGLLGTLVGGVPVIEFVWAVIFGAVWPVVVAFAFDARWRPQALP